MTEDSAPLVLAEFLPYRLSMLANRVSRHLSRLYADQFDLTVMDWRVMAIIGQYPGVSADQVCRRSELDKVAVSRAVRRLSKKNLLTRRVNRADRRKFDLNLSASGRVTYRRIIPVAQSFERELLASLSIEARAALRFGLTELERVTSQAGTPSANQSERL